MSSAPVMSSPEVEAILSRPAHLLYPEERYVAVEEYLTSSYRPDMDYVDGHLEVRNLGEYEHGQLQLVLLSIFNEHAKEWSIRVAPETRLQVTADRFRIPDVMVLSRTEEKPKRIVRTPPLLCIEILSPEDTFLRIQKRTADYLEMGVPHAWIFDPNDLGRVFVYENGQGRWVADRVLQIAGTEIRINLDEVAERLED
ncbi:Uma2 family endonuclease [Terriglobus aquaticus]|nr:Uma2 family endonuclease [Terriglobus aquaticus]